MSLNQINFWIDLGLLILFYLVMSPQATGIPLHEWISIAIMIPIVVHLLTHWKWIVNVVKKFFKHLPGETRFNQIWNILLFIMMNVAFFTGLLISEVVFPALGIAVNIDPFWVSLHNLSANVLLLMMGVHLAIHWNWIVNAVRRYLLRKPAVPKNA